MSWISIAKPCLSVRGEKLGPPAMYSQRMKVWLVACVGEGTSTETSCNYKLDKITILWEWPCLEITHDVRVNQKQVTIMPPPQSPWDRSVVYCVPIRFTTWTRSRLYTFLMNIDNIFISIKLDIRTVNTLILCPVFSLWTTINQYLVTLATVHYSAGYIRFFFLACSVSYWWFLQRVHCISHPVQHPYPTSQTESTVFA